MTTHRTHACGCDRRSDFYDPTIAAPVDRFNDLVADPPPSTRWFIPPPMAGTGSSPDTKRSHRYCAIRRPTQLSEHPDQRGLLVSLILIELDPPEHTAYRRRAGPVVHAQAG